ncbi:MAG: NnrS family protein [Sulfuricaulis sp.]
MKTAISPSPDRSNWKIFSAAPHRMLFLPGAAQAVLVMLLWLAELLGRAGIVPLPPMVLAPAWAHAYLMLFGLFPFFIFGFMLTVYPRWMNGPEVPASRYVAVFVFLTGGMILFYTGLFAARTVLELGLLLQLIGWGVGLYALLTVFRRAPKHGAHEIVLNLALLAALAGILGFLHGVATGSGRSLLAARESGLWLFLVPVVFVVSHRMIPFFSSTALSGYNAVRPAWSLPLLVVGVTGHATLELSGYPQWLFLFDAPLLAMAVHHMLLWKFRRSFEVRLLAMLHIAFLWFGVGMALYTIQSLTLLFGKAWILGRAPLHALGIGFITGMMVAMASRVTLGHSGRALAADDLTWRVLLGVNVTAVLRISAELAPASAGNTLNILAAIGWLVSLSPWVWRYAPMYLRPRVDGKPG